MDRAIALSEPYLGSRTHPTDEELHQAGMAAVLTAARRRLSLTDCVSFEVMRRRGIRQAPAFDRHFREQGFADVE
ncbi:MAG: hypothetical protein HY718_17855 [Planctomycetes bacterium]|nr:hypothetical protein [Planctomycetota bacterium]